MAGHAGGNAAGNARACKNAGSNSNVLGNAGSCQYPTSSWGRSYGKPTANLHAPPLCFCESSAGAPFAKPLLTQANTPSDPHPCAGRRALAVWLGPAWPPPGPGRPQSGHHPAYPQQRRGGTPPPHPAHNTRHIMDTGAGVSADQQGVCRSRNSHAGGYRRTIPYQLRQLLLHALQSGPCRSLSGLQQLQEVRSSYRHIQAVQTSDVSGTACHGLACS